MPQSIDFLSPPGIGGCLCSGKMRSTRSYEWMNLPETERQGEHQAAQFALKMKRKYPFDYAGGDRYQEIRRMMLRHYKRLAAASK